MTTNKERAVEVMRNFWHDGRYAVGFDEIAEALADEGLLAPDPQPRTLADIPWDDNVHPYMEAVTISGRRHILLAPMGDTAISENTILAAEHDGGMPVLVPAEYLFPTGRYARLSMPDEHPADAEDGPEPAQPSPEDVPVEEPWLVEFRGERYIGARDQYDAPNWALSQMDGTDIHFADDCDVILVSRLVPEVKA